MDFHKHLRNHDSGLQNGHFCNGQQDDRQFCHGSLCAPGRRPAFGVSVAKNPYGAQ